MPHAPSLALRPCWGCSSRERERDERIRTSRERERDERVRTSRERERDERIRTSRALEGKRQRDGSQIRESPRNWGAVTRAFESLGLVSDIPIVPDLFDGFHGFL